MASEISNLPPMIQEFVRLIGHAKTMRLVEEFGGCKLKVTANEDHPDHQAMVEVIGARATKVLVAEFSAEDPVYVAKCDKALRADRNSKIISHYEALTRNGHSGQSAAQVLAREHRLSYRSIETIVNRPQPGHSEISAQLSLI